MAISKESPNVKKMELRIWNYNPKTNNILSGTGCKPHPIFGDASESHSIFKITKKTDMNQKVLKSWFNHIPIAVYYDPKSARKESVFLVTTNYKATRIEPLNSAK